MTAQAPAVPADFWVTDQMRDALESWHIGRVIQAYRKHPFHGRALPQETVAQWLGVTQAQLSRIEGGPAVDDLYRLRRWATILRIPSALLWFKLKSTDQIAATGLPLTTAVQIQSDHRAEIDDMNRRELLRLMGVAGASLAAPAFNVDAASGKASAVDLVAQGQLAPVNAQLWALYDSAQVKASVMPLVRSQLEVLTNRIQNAATEKTRKTTAELLANVLQLAGEISFDLNRYTDAAHCYTMAAMASKEAGHYDLWACALIRHSFVSLHDQQFTDALPMLEAASRIAQRGNQQRATHQWASAVKAHAYANLGNSTSCLRSLEQAETVKDLSDANHTTGWLRFTSSRLPEERGTCFVELGQTDQAETHLNEALRQGVSERRRASINIDLAMLGLRAHDADQVVFYANSALVAAQTTQSGYVIKKLSTLQDRLEPLLDSHSVRELSDHITHLKTAAATN